MGRGSRLSSMKPLRNVTPPVDTDSMRSLGGVCVLMSPLRTFLMIYVLYQDLLEYTYLASLLVSPVQCANRNRLIIHPQFLSWEPEPLCMIVQEWPLIQYADGWLLCGGNKHTIRGRVELGYRNTTCRYYEKWNERKKRCRPKGTVCVE